MLKKDDLNLIKVLRTNCRAKVSEISSEINMPLSTVYEKINNTGNLIKRFTCILNHEEWGNSVHSFAIIKVSPKDKLGLQNELEQCNNVNLLWKINNGSDFLAEFIFKNLFEFESYKESLESRFSIKNISVYFMIDEVKKEAFLPL